MDVVHTIDGDTLYYCAVLQSKSLKWYMFHDSYAET